MFVDLPLEQLWEYRPDVAEPDDFDVFWRDRLAEARAVDTPATVTAVADAPWRHADVHDVTFAGSGGDPVRAWLLLPHRRAEEPACVVEFVGYNGGRGHPLDWPVWSALGHAHLVVDNRGQGGGWRSADTPDPRSSGEPRTAGFTTDGVLDPHRYYYTRLFVDAARALDAARSLPALAGLPLVTTGGSQGGALALAATHLAGEGVVTVMPDVPFLAHIRRAVTITAADPYDEIARFCRVDPAREHPTFHTLSYVDVVNHAKRVHVPGRFSVGLRDEIAPASTVFTAYHHFAGPKALDVYPFAGHEGGERHALHRKIAHLADVLG